MQDDIHTKHNKRIAKNTLLLYIRMLLVMAINFLITRELIGLLGVVDFGITNVIASIVTMFSFLSNTMAASISRYFNFYIGKNDFSTLKKFFNTSVEIYLLIGLLIFILSETLGVYCFYHKLVIPADRLNAAFIFFQASIFVFLLKVMIIPYYSMIISKEDMGVYATFNILEVSCKLIIVYMLYFCSASFDKLSTYGIALVGLEVVQFLLYSVYSNIKYKECRLFPFFDFKIFKELLSFGGWNLWGALSSLFNDVLINILLNNFFGAVINTARAIALQFSSGVTTFANNFMMASRPQITNYWASGDRDYSIKLAVNSAMFGFFMLLIIVIPIFIDVNFILDLW